MTDASSEAQEPDNTAQVNQSVAGSLRVRMLISAGLILIVFLGVMGLVLDNAYRISVEQTVSERLQLHIYALIAASDEDNADDANSLYLPDELQEPMFNRLDSGLFGFVFNSEGDEIWRSRSALDVAPTASERRLMLASATPGVPQFQQLTGTAAREPLFAQSYRVIWQSESGAAHYDYVVLENLNPYRNEVNAFRNNLWGWLIAGVIVLVGLQAAIMYWGLLPLSSLEGDLNAIEAGSQTYLEGQYPREIAGVTRSLNMLLADERRQREKYRTTLADLAHSLKTPLSILKNEAARPTLDAEIAGTLDEQVDRMNEIVAYQLERAVASSSLLYGASVPVAPVVAKLVSALQRVYQDKGVVINVDVADATFAGDERDLYELLGNLLDNACKYGHGRVWAKVTQLESGLEIVVEDDGAGIDVADRSRVLERGTRLDTRETGQGIGLAVVSEIVDRYNGRVTLDQSTHGGTRVSITFQIKPALT